MVRSTITDELTTIPHDDASKSTSEDATQSSQKDVTEIEEEEMMDPHRVLCNNCEELKVKLRRCQKYLSRERRMKEEYKKLFEQVQISFQVFQSVHSAKCQSMYVCIICHIKYIYKLL